MTTTHNLDDLIEEATVDCYDEEEQRAGFLSALEDNVVTPFPAQLAGRTVTVTGIDGNDRVIKALVESDGKIYPVDILDLKIDSKVKGSEWVAAYREWEG